jgi:putative ABC transport system permease protein
MLRDDDRVPAWRRYLRLTRDSPARDVDDELAFHLQSTVDELVASGMSPPEARTAARRKFGDLERISSTLYTLSRQRERRMTRMELFDRLRQDIVFATRQLRKNPVFTSIAVLTLALGIGANSAIFSVLYTVMLKPLPYANSERIITIGERIGDNTNAVTFGNYASWQQSQHTLDVMAAYWGGGPRTLTGRGDPTPVITLSTTPSFWRVQFIPPALGRYYNDDEGRIGAAPVAVISYALWQSRFNGDRGVIGKSLTLAGTDFAIVGVAAPDYILGSPAERIWVPMKVDPARWNDHADHEINVVALLKRGVSIDAARRELSAIERGLAKRYPNSGFEDVDVQSFAEALVGPVDRTLLFTLLGAVVVVLLIACANVANLLIARADIRRGEIAIRGALGASRARIVTQLLVESLLLGVTGGALGLVVAWAGVRFLVTSPASIARLELATLNLPVVLFTLALSVACAIVFGMLPALRAARLDLQQTLRDGGREASVSARERLRGLLVVGELCLCQILLIGAALLIRSALLVEAVPSGFVTKNLLITYVGLPQQRYGAPGALETGFQRLDAAIAAVPGVTSVGRTSLAPVQGGQWWNCNAMRPGSNGHDDGAFGANMRAANPQYFASIGQPILRGRAFNNTDVMGGPPVAIITRNLAQDLYGGRDPIGQLITSCVGGSRDEPRWRTVVGVIGDTKARGRTQEAPREMYMPSSQWQGNSSMAYLIRGAVPVTTLVPAIRRALSAVDPQLALSQTQTMDAAFAKQQAIPQFTMWLLSLLGLTGLVLALVGVYGVIGYFVTQRTHEFGVRMALGAPGASIRWMVVREGFALGLAGVGVGTAAAYILTRFLASFLFGVTTHDPLTYAAVAAALACVAALASYIPARRATRIDPLEALRTS